jgi:hypothetical protein
VATVNAGFVIRTTASHACCAYTVHAMDLHVKHHVSHMCHVCWHAHVNGIGVNFWLAQVVDMLVDLIECAPGVY